MSRQACPPLTLHLPATRACQGLRSSRRVTTPRTIRWEGESRLYRPALDSPQSDAEDSEWQRRQNKSEVRNACQSRRRRR
eukprot:768359-Hanusia_phi.AAC.4